MYFKKTEKADETRKNIQYSCDKQYCTIQHKTNKTDKQGDLYLEEKKITPDSYVF